MPSAKRKAAARSGAGLPDNYSSFAWDGGGLPGTRIVAGIAGGGLLDFQRAGDFQYEPGGGLETATAAFTKSGESPPEGWIAGISSESGSVANVERVSASPEPSPLSSAQHWPLPFRRPLLAIAAEPGTTPAEPNAQALTVGDEGQIARYFPEKGWIPEFLYNAEGKVQRPRLRGVAWPEPGRAYAVGDDGTMLLWRADTGLWEPDPAAPLGLHANLTAIAFSPVNPAVGYAVGKQGALLAYDKTWTQQPLPPGLGTGEPHLGGLRGRGSACHLPDVHDWPAGVRRGPGVRGRWADRQPGLRLGNRFERAEAAGPSALAHGQRSLEGRRPR